MRIDSDHHAAAPSRSSAPHDGASVHAAAGRPETAARRHAEADLVASAAAGSSAGAATPASAGPSLVPGTGAALSPLAASPFAFAAAAGAPSLPPLPPLAEGSVAPGPLGVDVGTLSVLASVEQAALGLEPGVGGELLADCVAVQRGLGQSLEEDAAADPSSRRLAREVASALGSMSPEEAHAEAARALAEVAPRLPAGTDPAAFVQAVLRESYLQQNETLLDFATKVRFYNELRKAIRAEKARAKAELDRLAGADGSEPVDFSAVDLGLGADGSADAGGDAAPWKYGDPVTTKAELEAYVGALDAKLQSVGDDAQLANLDLQNALQQQQQTLQLISGVSKTLHETALSIIRKIGG